MVLGSSASRARCGSVQLATTCGLAVVWLGTRGLVEAGLRTVVDGRLGTAPLDRVLAELCAVVLVACLAWLWLASTAVVIEAWGDVRAGTPGVPRSVRRVVLAACGVALVTAAVQPASAAPTAITLEGHGHRPDPVSLVDGLRLPDRAVGRGPVTVGHTGVARAPTGPPTVVVRPGDTLWSIAAAELPLGASDAQIDRRWRDVYALNRAALGPDPDLIRPGQQLRLTREDPS